MSQPRNFKAGYPYHIYNRGNNKADIFLDEDDYHYFFEKIREYSERYDVSLLAYCPMPNHYHLLLIPEYENSIPKMMQRVGIAYAYYYRRKYMFRGHIFQSRYNSKCVQDLAYFNTLLKYIQNNPVEAELVKDIKEYRYAYFNEELIKMIPHMYKFVGLKQQIP